MSTQINLKLSDKLFATAKKYSNIYGFESLQDFIRETIREKLFHDESVNGLNTYLASEKALARNWLNEEEDKAWAHLQKER